MCIYIYVQRCISSQVFYPPYIDTASQSFLFTWVRISHSHLDLPQGPNRHSSLRTWRVAWIYPHKGSLGDWHCKVRKMTSTQNMRNMPLLSVPKHDCHLNVGDFAPLFAWMLQIPALPLVFIVTAMGKLHCLSLEMETTLIFEHDCGKLSNLHSNHLQNIILGKLR